MYYDGFLAKTDEAVKASRLGLRYNLLPRTIGYTILYVCKVLIKKHSTEGYLL